jgi:L-seryl-tRNA(Ser) seleniumtransferase
MPPEVIDAMVEANRYFVDMHELTEAAGRRVAGLLGAEAALVTAGGFSSMLLGAAACLTGGDPRKIDALPHPEWPRRECLVQSAHRFGYDRAYRAAGMTIVEAETRQELRAKIGPNTAMIAVLAAVEEQRDFGPPQPRKRALPPEEHVLMPEELIAIGKETGVPVLVDMASDLPPASNLTRWVKEGADLVVVSGGKGLRGPQSTGILAGRKDLIDAARLNAAPNGNIGRGMKVGKEEMIALVVALERYLKLDHDREIAAWNEKARWLAAQLQGIRGLTAEYAVNTKGYADVDLSWDEKLVSLTHDEVRERLMAGSPPRLRRHHRTRSPAHRRGAGGRRPEATRVLRRHRAAGLRKPAVTDQGPTPPLEDGERGVLRCLSKKAFTLCQASRTTCSRWK